MMGREWERCKSKALLTDEPHEDLTDAQHFTIIQQQQQHYTTIPIVKNNQISIFKI
jgi:hypothetical protein